MLALAGAVAVVVPVAATGSGARGAARVVAMGSGAHGAAPVAAEPPGRHAAFARPPAFAAAPGGPRVAAMIVGRGAVLVAPAVVRAPATAVVASGRRCAVGAGTPLAVLAAVDRAGGPAFRTRDYGSCSRRPRDAGGLFVTEVGGERNRGRDGWVYKVGPRAGTTSAADPSGPFGDGRVVRSGQRVVWFWCRLASAHRTTTRFAGGARDSCQRTLQVRAPRRSEPGAALRLRVRGYDDNGRAVDVAGATVHLQATNEFPPGRAAAVTGADGRATVVLPAAGGSLTAVKEGLVPSFAERVVVG